ncbi:hypothetical protein HanPI659440_Chr09g0324881 [Helianthus annuus]|nr:hypothetical protein HanPI659440_Chr09g0324881 [Helianthus annuus]
MMVCSARVVYGRIEKMRERESSRSELIPGQFVSDNFGSRSGTLRIYFPAYIQFILYLFGFGCGSRGLWQWQKWCLVVVSVSGGRCSGVRRCEGG